MIGQDKLKDLCASWAKEPATIPALIVLAGRWGSGKKTAVEYIRKNVPNDGMFRVENNSVAAVREVIDKSYALGGRVFYVFQDCDAMRPQARNAMLKVMEEPPKNAHFILTVQNLTNVLPTIRSRAFVYEMQPYSIGELREYISGLREEEQKFLKDIPRAFLSTLGDAAAIVEMKEQWKDLYDYANSVVDYVGEATQANTLKIGTRLDIKGEDNTKFNLIRFLWVLHISLFLKFDKTRQGRYFEALKRSSKAWAELDIFAVNKQNVIDTLLLDLRDILREEK